MRFFGGWLDSDNTPGFFVALGYGYGLVFHPPNFFTAKNLAWRLLRTSACSTWAGLGLYPGRFTGNLQITHEKKDVNLQGCTFMGFFLLQICHENKLLEFAKIQEDSR